MPAPRLLLRPLESSADFAACVRLQRDACGPAFAELVPASILKVTGRIGGVVAGAFLDGDLAGFAHGLTGLEGGRLVHWSHMLLVRPALRDRGIGLRLALFQRDAAVRLGAQALRWSFDPLVARQAHLGLVRLAGCVRRLESSADGAGRHFLVELPLGDVAAVPTRPSHAARCVRVAVPPDIEVLAAAAPLEARAWRLRALDALSTLLARGYRVAGFTGSRDGECWYTLEPPTEPEES